MEQIYHNVFISILLCAVYGLSFFNFGLSTYMLNAPPIVIEKDLTESRVAYGFIGAAGYSLGPLIYINPTDDPTWHRVLRHEYQHYMQGAVLTPLGFGAAYSFDHYIIGHGYNENWFELDAERVERDDYKMNIFYWNTKEILHIEWEW